MKTSSKPSNVYGILHAAIDNNLSTKDQKVLLETATMTQPQPANTTYVYTAADLEMIFDVPTPWKGHADLEVFLDYPGIRVSAWFRDETGHLTRNP